MLRRNKGCFIRKYTRKVWFYKKVQKQFLLTPASLRNDVIAEVPETRLAKIRKKTLFKPGNKPGFLGINRVFRE